MAKSIFQEAKNDQAFLKAGFMGFTGSGKTYSGSLVARGLHRIIKERSLPGAGAPVFFIDTETGSDWVRQDFDGDGIKLVVAKTRAFVDLVPAIQETEKSRGILIIDSITHFWREITESYAKQKRRTRGLEFQDWAWLKAEWGKFTDAFVNSQCHIIMCGRAGYEYDFFENDSGKRELEKTGIKMKAETETGYEPSILVLMQRHQELVKDKDGQEAVRTWRTALVLKDRGRELDGHVFVNPTFENFMPHINRLNLGGVQLGVDTTRNSTGIIGPDGKSQFQIEREQCEIALDEIRELLVKYYPGQSADAKQIKGNLLEETLGSRSWERIQTLGIAILRAGRNQLWLKLEGQPYGFTPPVASNDEADEAGGSAAVAAFESFSAENKANRLVQTDSGEPKSNGKFGPSCPEWRSLGIGKFYIDYGEPELKRIGKSAGFDDVYKLSSEEVVRLAEALNAAKISGDAQPKTALAPN